MLYLAIKEIKYILFAPKPVDYVFIYHVDNTLKGLTPEERKKRRQSSVKPLVEAYFAWVKEKKADGRISEKSKTGRGLSYSINQEKYLKIFLEDGNVPMDNNAA